MHTAATWVWMKASDHGDEGSDLVAKFVAETGQSAAICDVSVRVARTPTGEAITLLVADHPWWKEHMRIHPAGWRGASLDTLAAKIGL